MTPQTSKKKVKRIIKMTTETTSSETLEKFQTPEGMEITGAFTAEFAEILTPEALTFIKELHQKCMIEK